MKSRTTFAILLALSTTAALNAQSYETTKADAAAEEDAVEGKPIVQPNLMVTGTVLEIDDNKLIVRGDNGNQMTFLVNGETQDASLFHVGDRVTASYVTLAGTGPVATRVVGAPATETAKSTGTVIYPPAQPVAAAPAPAPAPAPIAQSAPPVETRTTTVVTPVPAPAPTDQTAQYETLPQTASEMPLVAFLGFAAAAGAMTLRRRRVDA